MYGNWTRDLNSLPDSGDDVYEKFKELINDLKVDKDSYIEIFPTIKYATPVTANGHFINSSNLCIAFNRTVINQDTIGVCLLNDDGNIDDGNIINASISQPCGPTYGYPPDKNTIENCMNNCSGNTEWTDNKYCNGFPLYKENGSNICYSQCGTDSDGNFKDCRCNGWLQLLKKSNNTVWNDIFDVINIHGYHYFAHIIKLRILSTYIVFYNDINNPTNPTKQKKIWLTETCCIYDSQKPLVDSSGSPGCLVTDSLGISNNIKFINELFWQDTSIVNCSDSNIDADATSVVEQYYNDIKDFLQKRENSEIKTDLQFDFNTMSLDDFKNMKLPGIRTKNKINGTNIGNLIDKTWSELGFSCVTFFSACIPGWQEAGFPSSIKLENLCDSRLFNSDGTTNDIWEALKGKKINIDQGLINISKNLKLTNNCL